MAEEIQDTQELEFKRKQTQKRRLRGCLIIINALLMCYFLFLVGDLVVCLSKERANRNKDNIVSVCGRTVDDSKKLYSSKLADENIEVYDYLVYGNKFFVSENRISVLNPELSSFNDIAAVGICPDMPHQYTVMNHFENFNQSLDRGINFFQLEEGDYVLTSKIAEYETNRENLIPLKLMSGEMVNETYYSSVNEEGKRKAVTIKGKETSPALIVSVKEVNTLPQDYYDLVLINGNQEVKSQIEAIDESLKVTFTDSLKEAYKIKAQFAIAFDDQVSSILGSNYFNHSKVTKDQLIASGLLKGYDQNKYIRELGGNVFNAGYCVSDVEESCTLSSSLTNSKMSKFVLVTNYQTDLEQILNIFQLI